MTLPVATAVDPLSPAYLDEHGHDLINVNFAGISALGGQFWRFVDLSRAVFSSKKAFQPTKDVHRLCFGGVRSASSHRARNPHDPPFVIVPGKFHKAPPAGAPLVPHARAGGLPPSVTRPSPAIQKEKPPPELVETSKVPTRHEVRAQQKTPCRLTLLQG